jgi:prepilin-type N-terminal cleavage/methylation domain-containing protein
MKKKSKFSIPIRNDAGFTLVEVMVSLTLMTVGILGLLSSVNSVNHYQRQSKDMTLATMHAGNKLEEVKRVAANEPTGGAFGFGYLVDDAGYLNGYTAVNDWTRSSSDTVDGLTRSWSLSIYPASAQTAEQSFLIPGAVRMVEAVVTTSWTDEKGDSKSVEVATVLHRRQFLGVN